MEKLKSLTLKCWISSHGIVKQKNCLTPKPDISCCFENLQDIIRGKKNTPPKKKCAEHICVSDSVKMFSVHVDCQHCLQPLDDHGDIVVCECG